MPIAGTNRRRGERIYLVQVVEDVHLGVAHAWVALRGAVKMIMVDRHADAGVVDVLGVGSD